MKIEDMFVIILLISTIFLVCGLIYIYTKRTYKDTPLNFEEKCLLPIHYHNMKVIPNYHKKCQYLYEYSKNIRKTNWRMEVKLPELNLYLDSWGYVYSMTDKSVKKIHFMFLDPIVFESLYACVFYKEKNDKDMIIQEILKSNMETNEKFIEEIRKFIGSQK